MVLYGFYPPPTLETFLSTPLSVNEWTESPGNWRRPTIFYSGKPGKTYQFSSRTRAALRQSLSPNMVLVLPRTKPHTHNTTRRSAAGILVSSLLLLLFPTPRFSFRRRGTHARLATCTSTDLRAAAEVSLKEHSSSCAQSNTRPQSDGRKKKLHLFNYQYKTTNEWSSKYFLNHKTRRMLA